MAVPSHGTAFTTPLLRECRVTFDWWERFVGSSAGVGLMVVWAIAEATVWPIIPDVLLAFLSVATPRRDDRLLAAAIAGMALGGVGLYLFAYGDPRDAQSLLHNLPLVNSRQTAIAHRYLTAQGAVGFWYQPWSGAPFKVWAIEAGASGIAPWSAIPIFIMARGARMALIAAVAHVLGRFYRRALRDFSLFVATIALVVFCYGWWSLTLRA